MSEATVLAVVGRTLLGLPDLNIHDHTNYILSGPSFGSTIQYRRQQVKSPFVEGAVTTARVKDIVDEKVIIDVLSPDRSQVTLRSNIQTLIDAFTQDTFYLQLQLDSAFYKWSCEAADYTMDWSLERIHGQRVQMTFQIPRQPSAISGPY